MLAVAGHHRVQPGRPAAAGRPEQEGQRVQPRPAARSGPVHHDQVAVGVKTWLAEDALDRLLKITFTGAAAVEAGLGVSIRTPIGLPKTVCILGTESHLPNLDTIDLLLYRANDQPDSHVQRLEDILIETIRERLESDFIKPSLRLSRKRRH